MQGLRVFGAVCLGGSLVGAGPVVAGPEMKVELSLYAVNGGQVQPGVAVQDVVDRRSGDSDSLRSFGEAQIPGVVGVAELFGDVLGEMRLGWRVIG